MRDDEIPCPFTLSLIPGATLEVHAGGRMRIAVDGKQHALGLSSPGLVVAMQRLAGSGGTEAELRERVVELEGNESLAALYHCLLELSSTGLLAYGVRVGDTPLLTAVPVDGQFRPGAHRLNPTERFISSRFAFLRRDGTTVVLESPLSFARVLLSDWRGAAMLAAFAAPSSLAELNSSAFSIPDDVLAVCVDLLWTLRFLRRVDAAGAAEEELDEAVDAWEFHDLLFHSRSRRGRHRSPYGATYRLRGRTDPLPAIKPRMSDAVIPLFRPDLEDLRIADQSFTTVLEDRHSRRHHDNVPITDRQLGEFPYRACRVRRVIAAGGVEPYEATDRVYPSGGAAYPLEVYVLVQRCQGIPAGLHHYRASDHALTQLSPPNGDTDALVRSAAYAAASPAPQVLIVLAARMQRVSWKYSSMAYAVILKDVGVLYQTMYLVATAMGLAGCALGGGNADVFAKASGLAYCVESSVGEFMLGSAPSSSTA